MQVEAPSNTFIHSHGIALRIRSATHEGDGGDGGTGKEMQQETVFSATVRRWKWEFQCLTKVSFGVSIQTLSGVSFPEPSWDNY